MKPSFLKRLFTALAFVALVGILAFGGGFRYLCYCSGSVVISSHEHCHGEPGEEGPVQHGSVGHRHNHDDEHEDHRHELVKSSTDLRLPDVVTAPELKLIPLFWTALSEWETAWSPASVATNPRPRIMEDPPPLSHQVARAVVRLI